MVCAPMNRVLDVALESEDEDAIIERRRQLRQAIVQKYKENFLTPQAEMSSLATTPARSDTSGEDSDAVGTEAAKDLEETIHQEEMKRRLEDAEGEGGSSVGVGKVEAVSEMELVQRKTNLQAMKAAVRNADMFSEEDMFGEKKYLVRPTC